MAIYRVTNIEYDTDGETVNLPTTMLVTIDDDADPEEAIADAVSDKTGWCVLRSPDFFKVMTARPADSLTLAEAATLTPRLIALLNAALSYEQAALDRDEPVDYASVADRFARLRVEARAVLGDLALPRSPEFNSED